MSKTEVAGCHGGTISKLDKSAFDLRGFGDELRVDRLCQGLLRRFYDRLLEDGVPPAEATGYANGADYYVRDFVIDRKRLNILAERAGIVRQFAGNWYIVNTIEPKIGELSGMLEGIKRFYRFLAEEGLISARHMEETDRECDDHDYYRNRIESFWAITGDGYLTWEKECSLKGD